MEKIVQIFIFQFPSNKVHLFFTRCVWFFPPDACCSFSLGNYSNDKLWSLLNFYLKESEYTDSSMIVKDSLFRQYSAFGVAGIFWTTEEVVGKK